MLCALALLMSLGTRADAAMVLEDLATPHESICSAAGALGEGGCLLDAAPTAESVFALGDLDLIGRGGDFLAGTASSALRSAEAITPVPLPAAAWLLAMGLGGLGLMGRRRRETLPSFRDGDGVEPLAASLRNSARTEAADHRRARVRLDGFRRLIDAFRDSLLNAARPHAFAPGRSSPCRPEGGAGSLWAAVAKRGPPEGDAIERAGGNPHPMPAGASALFFCVIGITRGLDGLDRLFARFFRAPDAPFAVPALAPVRVVAFRATDNCKNRSNPHFTPRPLALVGACIRKLASGSGFMYRVKQGRRE